MTLNDVLVYQDAIKMHLIGWLDWLTLESFLIASSENSLNADDHFGGVYVLPFTKHFRFETRFGCDVIEYLGPYPYD